MVILIAAVIYIQFIVNKISSGVLGSRSNMAQSECFLIFYSKQSAISVSGPVFWRPPLCGKDFSVGYIITVINKCDWLSIYLATALFWVCFFCYTSWVNQLTAAELTVSSDYVKIRPPSVTLPSVFVNNVPI